VLQVAVIGDYNTAPLLRRVGGYVVGSTLDYSWPAQLQQMLGNGTINVTNYAYAGASVQRTGSHPFYYSHQYQQLLRGPTWSTPSYGVSRWDVVISALGQADARIGRESQWMMGGTELDTYFNRGDAWWLPQMILVIALACFLFCASTKTDDARQKQLDLAEQWEDTGGKKGKPATEEIVFWSRKMVTWLCIVTIGFCIIALLMAVDWATEDYTWDGNSHCVISTECPFSQSYIALLRNLQQTVKTNKGLILAIPPPVMKDRPLGIIGCEAVNTVLPLAIPLISSAAGLPITPISFFSALDAVQGECLLGCAASGAYAASRCGYYCNHTDPIYVCDDLHINSNGASRLAVVTATVLENNGFY